MTAMGFASLYPSYVAVYAAPTSGSRPVVGRARAAQGSRPSGLHRRRPGRARPGSGSFPEAACTFRRAWRFQFCDGLAAVSGETQGIHEHAMLPDVDFGKLSWMHKNGFVGRGECFVAATKRAVGWAKAHLRRAHHLSSTGPLDGGHASALPTLRTAN